MHSGHMSAPEKRTRAQQRVVAAQQPRRQQSVPSPSVPRGRTGEPEHTVESEAEAHDHAAAQTEGLELAGRLGSGRGTRSWLAKEEQSREKFTVTFATGTSAQERDAQQRAMVRVAEYWVGVADPHLVAVRGTIGQGETAQALVTEHTEGISLARRIVEDGRVPPAELSPILAAAARGLATLHDHGWVHGTMSPHRILLGPEGQVRIDGYGLPDTSGPTEPGETAQPVTAASWGHDDRPEMLDRAIARSPADDVKALATLAWLALTGRSPGSDSHRVPLTLVCPAAPRGLVLMLEAALNDDLTTRPTAHEFATGIAAIPAVKVPSTSVRPQPPDIIRADGTEVKLGRTMLPRLRRGSTVAAAPHGRSRRHPLLLACAATALVACAWFALPGVIGTGGSPVAGEPQVAGSEESDISTPGESRVGPAPEVETTAPSATATEPGQDTTRAAEHAARALVTSRAEALAAGDQKALEAVYVPGSRLQKSDQSTIAHAAEQDVGSSGYTALSGLSMKVERIEALTTAPGEHGKPAENSHAGGAHTFYTEILTRGWHGEIPEGAHVERENATVRQTAHLTVTRTDEGWRIVDVTPVARQSR